LEKVAGESAGSGLGALARQGKHAQPHRRDEKGVRRGTGVEVPNSN
jgi:hypothetical protein